MVTTSNNCIATTVVGTSRKLPLMTIGNNNSPDYTNKQQTFKLNSYKDNKFKFQKFYLNIYKKNVNQLNYHTNSLNNWTMNTNLVEEIQIKTNETLLMRIINPKRDNALYPLSLS